MLAQLTAIVANTGFRTFETQRDTREFLISPRKRERPPLTDEQFNEEMERTMMRAAAYQAKQVA